MLKQPPGQLDSRGPAHPESLPAEGPDHPGPVRNDQIGGGNHGPEFGLLPGRHRHLGIECDDLAAAAGVQGQGRGQNVGRHIHSNA